MRKNHLPRTWIFFLTSQCNKNCLHCFNRNNLNRGDDLSLDEIKQISSKLGVFKTLMISGGEPTQRADLLEILCFFHKNNKIREIFLPTNGTNLRMIKLVLEKMDEIGIRTTLSVPVEGFQTIHDQIRGQGSFVQSLNLLEIQNKNTICVTTVTKKNLFEIKKLNEFLIKKGIKHLISPARPGGLLEAPSKKEWDELVREIDTTIFQKITYKMMSEALGGKAFACTAGKDIGVIWAEGSVSCCEQHEPTGNLRDVCYDASVLLARKIKGCVCTHPCFISEVLKNPSTFLYYLLRYFN